MGGPWLIGGIVAVALGCGLSASHGDDIEAARQAAERDARVFGWLIQRGLRVLAPPAAPANGEPALDGAQRQQLDQQAKQMERFFQPMLHAELELVRGCCGGLEPEARAKILAGGRTAVAATARSFAERQLKGQLGQDRFEPMEEVRRRIAEVVAEHASPDEVAAYRAALDERQRRQTEAERVAIVARLDRFLDLTAAQRAAIESDLERQWQPVWGEDIDRRGQMRVNNYPLAPDRAAAAIAPHLDAGQAAEWEKWCRMAPSRMAPNHFIWNFDGQGLQQLDAWWGR